MAHSHSHNDHHHSHAPNNFGRSFLIAAALNVIFIIAEIIYGLKSNSLALLADAGHNFSDVIGLILACVAWYLSKRAPTQKYTYGLSSSSIVAALINTILLLIAIGGIILEAVQRLNSTQHVAGSIVMWVAGFGILINGFTAWLFSKGQNDLNVKAAFFHLLSDAVVSAGVVAAGFAIIYTGWLWLDPAVSLLIAAVIIWGTWGLLRDSVNLSLNAVPNNINYTEVKTYLASLPDVKEVHDLHIWGMNTTEAALTAHLQMANGHPGDVFLEDVTHELHHKFGIGHSTIQIELGNGKSECGLAPDTKI